jgi:hypothetical protein
MWSSFCNARRTRISRASAKTAAVKANAMTAINANAIADQLLK